MKIEGLVDDLMKIEGLVDDETTVGSSDRAGRAILGILLGVFWPIQAMFVAGELLCDVRTPS